MQRLLAVGCPYLYYENRTIISKTIVPVRPAKFPQFGIELCISRTTGNSRKWRLLPRTTSIELGEGNEHDDNVDSLEDMGGETIRERRVTQRFQEALRMRTRYSWKICIATMFLTELQMGCIQYRYTITSSHQYAPLDTLLIAITIHTTHWSF